MTIEGCIRSASVHGLVHGRVAAVVSFLLHAVHGNSTERGVCNCFDVSVCTTMVSLGLPALLTFATSQEA